MVASAPGRVWHGRVDRRSGLRVEQTDSLGVPVVIVSDGTEHIVVPAERLRDLVAMLKRAEVAFELDAADARR